MKNIAILLIILTISIDANAFDIWINEKLWTPPGECMIHSESLLAPPQVHCIQNNLKIEIILDSSYKELEWVKEKIPAIRGEARENGKYFVRGKTEYFEISRANQESGTNYYSRFILGERVYVHVTAQTSKALSGATNQIWK